ncbi:MAG: hypothetical protein JO057_31840 [Chloroflexi bacterium]|nr:hypothetical protein [Chloroflexota bacterium]
MAQALARARESLARCGLLLFSDPALPSLVGMIVDAPLHTSWLAHPRGPVIYAAMQALEDDPQVLSTKLIAGKVTYVHKRLWPALYAVGSGGAAWQLDGLSAAGHWLLDATHAAGEIQTDQLVIPPEVQASRRVADAARELERRVLVHATEVHTPSGAHAKVLQSWPRWAAAVHLPTPRPTPAAAQTDLEAAANLLAAETLDAHVRLPWRKTPTHRRPRVAP